MMASLRTTREINLQLERIKVSAFDVELEGKKLGSGSYGAVFTVKYRRRLCAAKQIHSILFEETEEKLKLLDTFSRECCQCSELEHPNIVKFLGIYFPNNQLLPVMLMELMDASLRVYLEKSLSRITLTLRSSILVDVAEGLSYLHHRTPPVVHRDLTPNNILLKLPANEGGVLVAKISDLGVAKAVETNKKIQQRLTQLPGSPGFMPPETFEENPIYNTSLDVFSYGGVVLFVANQIWPDPSAPNHLNHKTKKLVAFTEVQRRQKYLDKMKDGVEIWKPLVESCLSNNPAERPKMVEVSEKLKSFKLAELEIHIKELANKLQQERKSYSDHELKCLFESKWKEWINSFTTGKTQVVKYPSDGEIEEEIVRILRQLLQTKDELLVSKLLAKPLNERSCSRSMQLLINKDAHLSSTRWLGFKSLGTDDITLAKQLTEECLASASVCLNTIKVELKPFTSEFACEVLKKLFNSVDAVMKSEKKNGFVFTSEYKVDMALTMCAHASNVFKQTTKKLKDNNPIVRLNKIKFVFLNIFKELYKSVNRSSVVSKVNDMNHMTKKNLWRSIGNRTCMFIILPLVIIVIAFACLYIA